MRRFLLGCLVVLAGCIPQLGVADSYEVTEAGRINFGSTETIQISDQLCERKELLFGEGFSCDVKEVPHVIEFTYTGDICITRGEGAIPEAILGCK